MFRSVPLLQIVTILLLAFSAACSPNIPNQKIWIPQ